MGWPRPALKLVLPVLVIAAAIGAPAVARAYSDWPEVVAPFSVADTLTAPYAFRGYTLHMQRGETITATLTTSPSAGKVDFRESASVTPYFIVADPASAPQTLTVSVEESMTIWLMIDASAPGTFTLDVADSPPPKIKLYGVTVPKKARHGHAFRVGTRLSSYDRLWSPIRFFVQRRSQGSWSAYHSHRGWEIYDKNGYFWYRYDTHFRLPQGRYRVRARFQDAARPVATYDRWKYITVD